VGEKIVGRIPIDGPVLKEKREDEKRTDERECVQEKEVAGTLLTLRIIHGCLQLEWLRR